MWRRVCQEAGGQLQRTGLLRDTNLGNILPTDNRRLECVVNGLPPLGQQLAVDATLVNPLKRTEDARPQAHCKDGVALAEARKDKERKYPELLIGTRCRLVVVAMEVGGRWSEEAHYFLETLAEARAKAAPKALKGSTFQACKRRWTAMLAVAGMRSLAHTLLEEPGTTELHLGGEVSLAELLGEDNYAKEPAVSRMPARA